MNGLDSAGDARQGDVGEKFYGKYRGTVVNNLDPMQLGRIQVMVPDVLGLSVSSWAMPACRSRETVGTFRCRKSGRVCGSNSNRVNRTIPSGRVFLGNRSGSVALFTRPPPPTEHRSNDRETCCC